MTSSTAAPNVATLNELLGFGDRKLYSVYLDLSVGSNGQRSHEIFLKKKESQFLELIGDNSAERSRFEAALRAVRSWLDDGYDGSSPAAALFLSEEGSLLKALHVPAHVDNLFALQPGAALAPLARVVEDHDHHCIVVLDNTRARILSVYLNKVEGEESYADETIPPRTRGGGWSQARFQRHRADHVQHFHTELVDHLQRFVKRHGSDDIILLGTEEATAEFQRELPQALHDVVRFVRPAPTDESPSALLKRIQGILDEEQAREDEVVLHRLERRVREDYLAVGGVRATLRELQSGKVDTLVLGRSLPREGRQCTRCAFVLADGEAVCPYCGGEVGSVNLYEKMVELAERHDAKVEFLDGDAETELLHRLNGAGAFLKFP
jgi:peptide subunit release factor 1 (eRF1)